jgi:hypothetical protein
MTIDHSNPNNTHRPWQLVLLLSNAQHHTTLAVSAKQRAQFRNRQDAEDHLRTIQRLARNSRFALLFVPPYDPDPSEP